MAATAPKWIFVAFLVLLSLHLCASQFRFNDAPDGDHAMNKDAIVEGRNNDSNMSKKIEKARDVIGKELCATNNNNNNCGDNQNNNHGCIIPPHDRGPYNYVPLPPCGEVTPPIDNESCLPPVPEPIVIPPPFNCPLVEPCPRCDVCIDLQSKGYGESAMSPAPPPKQGSRAVP